MIWRAVAGLAWIFAGPGALCLDAGQVDWASSAFSAHVRSDGQPLDDSFVFELGGFADGFVPTAANAAEWAAHWRVAQRARYHEGNQLFAGSYVVESNVSPFGTADLGYVWGSSPQYPGEWVLLTAASWKWPTAGGADPPVIWTAAGADRYVIGDVRPEGEPYFLKLGRVDAGAPRAWITADEWRGRYFTPEAVQAGAGAWTADPDGDGRTNLWEMGAGSDPRRADPPTLPRVEITADGTLEMSVDKVPRHLMGYVVEVSEDLVSWRSDPAAVEVILDSATRLVVRDRTRLAGLQRRFLRLTLVLEE